jgi:hypothetical protein
MFVTIDTGRYSDTNSIAERGLMEGDRIGLEVKFNKISFITRILLSEM